MSYAATVAAADAPPRFLGERFDAEARPLRASGCTIVAHVDAAAARALTAARDALRSAPAGRCFAWLPPASWHMTLYDGLLHARREPDYWPAALATDATEAEADAFMRDRLAACPPPAGGPFRMVTRALETGATGGVWVAMAAESPDEDRRLRGWRDALAEACGLRHRPGHDAYPFHITMAYAIGWAAPDDAADFDAALARADAALRAALPRIEAWPPDFCRFEDMTHFEPVLRLGQQSANENIAS